MQQESGIHRGSLRVSMSIIGRNVLLAPGVLVGHQATIKKKKRKLRCWRQAFKLTRCWRQAPPSRAKQ
jgi:hypothetical protein